MNCKKIVFAVFLGGIVAANVFAGNVRVFIEITGVTVNGGDVHVFVFSNEQDYKKDISFTSFVLRSTNDILAYELNLPEGEYLISSFQDVNSNGKTDTGFLGIPKEPVGITNYNGRGAPGGFNKHKVLVDSDTTKISVNLGVIKL
jgi:uncharacterized protein (DUF2141 family)